MIISLYLPEFTLFLCKHKTPRLRRKILYDANSRVYFPVLYTKYLFSHILLFGFGS